MMKQPMASEQVPGMGASTRIQIWTETKGPFKGRSYRVTPDGKIGERVFREDEKIPKGRRTVRMIK